MSDDRQSVICGARTRKGGRCKHPPEPGSVPPRCFLHNGGGRSPKGRLRCKARHAAGRHCRQWAEPGGEYCIWHLPRRQQNRQRAAGRICTARTVKGNPCRARAVKGTDPPRCPSHSSRAPDRKRCRARTKRGRPCRGQPTNHSIEQGRPLCPAHAGLCHPIKETDGQMKPPHRPRCQARTRNGKRCRNWALVDSQERFGRPVCRLHALPDRWPGRSAQGPGPGHRCQARRPSGRRCRNWALRRSKARHGRWLCRFHVDDKPPTGFKHGFYSAHPDFSPEERAAIRRAAASGEPLAGELLLLRLKLRRLMRYLAREDLPAWRRDAAARAAFRGAAAVKQLLLTRHNLSTVRWTSASGGSAGQQLAALLQEEEE